MLPRAFSSLSAWMRLHSALGVPVAHAGCAAECRAGGTVGAPQPRFEQQNTLNSADLAP